LGEFRKILENFRKFADRLGQSLGAMILGAGFKPAPTDFWENSGKWRGTIARLAPAIPIALPDRWIAKP